MNKIQRIKEILGEPTKKAYIYTVVVRIDDNTSSLFGGTAFCNDHEAMLTGIREKAKELFPAGEITQLKTDPINLIELIEQQYSEDQ